MNQGFRFSLVVLSLSVITKLSFSQGYLTDSLIAWYPFTNNALDATGNGNDGTVAGATLTADLQNLLYVPEAALFKVISYLLILMR